MGTTPLPWRGVEIVNAKLVGRVHRVTSMTLLAAIGFAILWQVSKGVPFRAVNPFGQDPYDAVGSIAVQVALFVGALSWARFVRIRHDPSQSRMIPLIVRGDALVASAILVTIIADAIAVLAARVPQTSWGNLLLAGLAAVSASAMACLIALAASVPRLPPIEPPADLTPADAIDDLRIVVRRLVIRLRAFLPGRLVEWVEAFRAESAFRQVPWIDPRSHPWRFACASAILAGMALALAQLREGLPHSLESGLLVVFIFVGSEAAAVIAAFALFGKVLGLRPSRKRADYC